MSIETAYTFLFETYAGVGILIGACALICLLLAAVLEKRTRRIFKDRSEGEPVDSEGQDGED